VRSGNAIKQKDGRPARDARQRVFDGYWFDAELIAIAGH
jgi:hypothetical protein